MKLPVIGRVPIYLILLIGIALVPALAIIVDNQLAKVGVDMMPFTTANEKIQDFIAGFTGGGSDEGDNG